MGWGEGGGGGEVEKEGEEGHTIVCMAPAAFDAPDGIIISALTIEKLNANILDGMLTTAKFGSISIINTNNKQQQNRVPEKFTVTYCGN